MRPNSHLHFAISLHRFVPKLSTAKLVVAPPKLHALSTSNCCRHRDHRRQKLPQGSARPSESGQKTAPGQRSSPAPRAVMPLALIGSRTRLEIHAESKPIAPEMIKLPHTKLAGARNMEYCRQLPSHCRSDRALAMVALLRAITAGALPSGFLSKHFPAPQSAGRVVEPRANVGKAWSLVGAIG